MSATSDGRLQQVALVTGASSGIGLHTALGLARAGMSVLVAGRNRTRTEAACRFVTKTSGSGNIEPLVADFSRLSDVRRLASEVLSRHDRLDILVNNAGLFSPKYRLSAEGFELTFAVNHLAPFLLTNLLLERLKGSAAARIITVASEAHRGQRMDIGDLPRPRDWTMLRAYGRSKLCNILFTRDLASRLDPGEVVAACLHPGMVATAIGHRGGLVELGWRLMKPFMIGPEQGAETSVFLSTLRDATPFHGAYVVRKAPVEPDTAARDNNLARGLWDESARLVGLE